MFEQFKQVVNMVAERKHLTHKGISEILEIAYDMNTRKRRVDKNAILQGYIKLESSQAIRQSPV